MRGGNKLPSRETSNASRVANPHQRQPACAASLRCALQKRAHESGSKLP
jgi:hypothetical protein